MPVAMLRRLSSISVPAGSLLRSSARWAASMAAVFVGPLVRKCSCVKLLIKYYLGKDID